MDIHTNFRKSPMMITESQYKHRIIMLAGSSRAKSKYDLKIKFELAKF